MDSLKKHNLHVAYLNASSKAMGHFWCQYLINRLLLNVAKRITAAFIYI